MSYLVLARQWRPQVFEDVIGQRPITQTLQNAISQNRVSHAFLFSGARGVGKTSTARILAKALNCQKGPQINPCNDCANCKEITDGTSMDVIEIDGASNRGIEEIRELKENVRYTPAKSRHKIYIIDEVHMLTREAFNALLKTLEEPPSHIIFVFATTEPHKIPATILSRCQRYDFKRIPLKEMVGNLKQIVEREGIQISQRGLQMIVRESEGSMRDAQSLLDQVISYGGKEIRDEDITEVLGLIDQKILSDTIEAIADRDAKRCVEIVEHIYQYGYDIQHFCQELLHTFRNLILIKVSEHPEGLMELPPEELEGLKKQAERFQFEQLNHLFTLLLRGEEEVAQSTFPRTMLEITLIRMATLRPVLPIDEILKKLEGMEKTSSIGGATKTAGVSQPGSRIGPTPPPGRVEQPKKSLEGKVGEKVIEKEKPSGKVNQKGIPSSGQEEKDLEVYREERSLEESSKVSEEVWRGLVDFTRARNPILGSFLVFGNPIRLSDEKVEIGFEKDSFHYDRILEKGNQSQLELICREYFKKNTKVIISPIKRGTRPPGAPSYAERNGQDNLEEKIKNGMEGNSLVQEALRLFDGRIVKK
ncbi:MAG: DNA polymerase III subunit gamma/tau [Deltaproteobacteria bacterium]|nr:DNA polymerase III subunit gamma/tau [Deltaproteobacteria bacterium]